MDRCVYSGIGTTLNLNLYERDSFGVGGNLNWLYGMCDTP